MNCLLAFPPQPPAMPNLDRRSFLRSGASAGFGLAACSLSSQQLLAQCLPLAVHGKARADAIIHLHLDGGLSHIDSFDPKPEAPLEVRGPFGTVRSKLDGEPFGEHLARTAAVADKLVLLRAMTHSEADHERGQHSVLTGYPPSPALVHPGLGALVALQLGGQNNLPPYVCIPQASRYLGNGFLSAAVAPFSVGGNPAAAGYKVRDLEPPKDLDPSRRQRRAELQELLNSGFAPGMGADAVTATEANFAHARALIESAAARSAFDLAAEPNAVQERYGKRQFGMSCLLAKRLVAAGCRYVVVGRGGFDHHSQLATGLPPLLSEIDQGLAALLADLDAEGRLDRTLVLLTSEFGRTPRLNQDAGRDHWPRVFSVVMAGGGLKRGIVHGRSNATGAEPAEGAVRPADLAATALQLLGIDPFATVMAPGNRPVALVRDGRVLTELLA